MQPLRMALAHCTFTPAPGVMTFQLLRQKRRVLLISTTFA